MAFTREDVEKVALLARLRLSSQEIDTLTAQLGRVVEYIDLLSELDTDGVEPMAHAVERTNVLAADRPVESLSRDEALGGAPKRDDECYLVPAVLGES